MGSDGRFGHGWYGMGPGMMGFGLPDGGYLERAPWSGCELELQRIPDLKLDQAEQIGKLQRTFLRQGWHIEDTTRI